VTKSRKAAETLADAKRHAENLEATAVAARRDAVAARAASERRIEVAAVNIATAREQSLASIAARQDYTLDLTRQTASARAAAASASMRRAESLAQLRSAEATATAAEHQAQEELAAVERETSEMRFARSASAARGPSPAPSTPASHRSSCVTAHSYAPSRSSAPHHHAATPSRAPSYAASPSASTAHQPAPSSYDASSAFLGPPKFTIAAQNTFSQARDFSLPMPSMTPVNALRGSSLASAHSSSYNNNHNNNYYNNTHGASPQQREGSICIGGSDEDAEWSPEPCGGGAF
jgi:hypothetical protein